MTAVAPTIPDRAWFEFATGVVHQLAGIAVSCSTTEVLAHYGTTIPATEAWRWGTWCVHCWPGHRCGTEVYRGAAGPGGHDFGLCGRPSGDGRECRDHNATAIKVDTRIR